MRSSNPILSRAGCWGYGIGWHGYASKYASTGYNSGIWHLGDVKPIREGVSELRIDHGPGYRVYFVQTGPVVIVLLGGGDKLTQDTDIARAVTLARHWKE